MNSRITARLLAGLASAAILVAACGSGTASNGPTSPPVTQPPVTAGPIATQGPDATFDLASFHADVQLEALFPDEIGGVPVNPISMSGADMMGDGGSPEIEAMLAALHKTPADLSAAIAGSATFQLLAFQVDGAQGSDIVTALFAAYAGETATVTDASFGGKSVKKVVTSDGETSYIYPTQDVVFLVGGDEVTDAILNEIFSKLR